MARRAPEELSSSLPWEPVRRAKSPAPPQTFRISNRLRGPSRLRLNRPVIWTRVTIPEPPRPHVRPWLPVSTGWGAPAPPGSAPHRPNQNPWGENRYRLHFKFPRGLRRSTESAGPCARAPLAQGNCHLGPIQNTRFLTRPGDLSAQAPSRGVAARPARGPTPARPAVPSPRHARRAIGEKLPPPPRRGSLRPHVPCHTRPCQCVCFQTPSVPSQNRGTRRPLPGPPAPAVTDVRAVSTDLSVG